MQIYVKNFSDKHNYITLVMEPTTTILEVRGMIADKAIHLYWPNDPLLGRRDRIMRGFHPGKRWPPIYYNSKTLSEQDYTLADYGIEEESTLVKAYGLAVHNEKKDVKTVVKNAVNKVAKKVGRKSKVGRKGAKKDVKKNAKKDFGDNEEDVEVGEKGGQQDDA